MLKALKDLTTNQPLMAALLASFIAQIAKLGWFYIKNKKWNWALLFRAGGMPSSHSATVAAVTHSVGLNYGFGTPIFAVSFVLATIVIYDATGVRRQAGKHAEIINRMIMDLAAGNPLKQEQLREVLGHTPMEAIIGMILGVLVAQIFWLIALP
jgi:acid phosphatase family membrane protein YuiD